MKKILLLLALLLIPAVLAQDLEVSIVSYTPETGATRLRIYNPTDINYFDLKYSIDDKQETDIVQRLASNIAISIFPTIPQGKHNIKITSSNGLDFEKTLTFTYTEEQIIEQRQKLEEYNKKQLEKFKPQIKQEIEEIEQAKKRKPYYIIAISLAILALIIYYIIRKIRK